jgi:acid phosphatase family membrane protein YuiD
MVKSYNVKPVLLTNGLKLTSQKVKELKRNSLFGFDIHIDKGQFRPGWSGKFEKELNTLRQRYTDMIDKEGHMICGFNTTILPEILHEVPDMNSIIASAVTAWIMAQSIKIVWGLAKYGSRDICRIPWRILWAGGMPSAHSAVVTAITITILFHAGVESMIFGLTMVVSCIIIYDRLRMHSLYHTFQKRYPSLKEGVQKNAQLTDLVGHSVMEVIVGILTGTYVGLLL